MGREACRFLSDLGDIAAKATFVWSVRQQLSYVLFRGNGGMCFQATFSIVRAVGRQFMPGCECPTNQNGEVLALSTNLGDLELLFSPTL